MIVILGKDKDFSHTLAEQIVRELGEPCECAESLEEAARRNLGASLLVAAGAPPKTGLPLLVLKPPLYLREVLADIKRMLKLPDTQDEIAFLERFRLSPRSKELSYTLSGKRVGLTDKEMQLLVALIERENVPKDELLRKIWGIEADLNTHTLETHIYRLRAKCKELSGSEMIVAVDGGYALAL